MTWRQNVGIRLAGWTLLGVLFPVPVIPWLAWRTIRAERELQLASSHARRRPTTL